MVKYPPSCQKPHNFSTKVSSARHFFDQLYETAASTEEADQEKVADLQEKIDELNQKLTHINNSEISMLVIDTAAAGVAIYALIEEDRKSVV